MSPATPRPPRHRPTGSSSSTRSARPAAPLGLFSLPVPFAAASPLPLFLAVVSAVLPSPAPAAPAEKPNVIIVITDDQGYGDLSCHGNPVLKTPHLDALAAESVRFEDFHVSPTCAPTRASLLTGRWANRTGVWHTIAGRSLIRHDEVTLGRIFAEAGYATGMFGKWHLGDNYPMRPEDMGFTEVFRHGGGGIGQTPDHWDNAYFGGTYFHNGSPVPAEGYCTDLFFNRAKEFIAKQAEAGQPFLAYLPTNAPHSPNHAPPEYAAPYEDLGDEKLAHFYGMIANIDDNVGALRAFLEEKGLAENTIFLFTTDNGTAAGPGAYRGGMRGGKGSEYEGGHRVPLFLHWPGGGHAEERTIGTLSAHIDLVPTLADLCGIPVPGDLALDGLSLRPLLEDPEAAGRWPDRILVVDSQRVLHPVKWRKSSVMSQGWRLVSDAGADGTPVHELYRLDQDPEQKNDVLGEHPGIARQLKDFYEQWWAELAPGFAEPVRIVLGHPGGDPVILTAHDWFVDALTPWNQSHIREGHAGETGPWQLEAERPGRYRFELRRWPKEGEVADTPLTAAIPAGEDVPGVQAYRARPGVSLPLAAARLEIAGQSLRSEIPDGAPAVIFEVELAKGPAELAAHFESPEGETFGAYYVYVTRLGD